MSVGAMSVSQHESFDIAGINQRAIPERISDGQKGAALIWFP
jgi:hypothetical protein